MEWITRTALNRRTVTVLAIALVLAAGVFTYRTLPVELFPEVEFPLVTVTTFYPSANPESVARDVTAPIENVMSGLDGLEGVQSFSSENRSIILGTFEFGTDMDEVEANLNSSVNGISFPDGVVEPIVGRINPDSFPVLQLSVTGERDLVELQDILDSRIMPEISGVEGVFRVEVTGEVQQQAQIVVDPGRMRDKGVSLFQVSQALSENSVAFPGGAISDGGGPGSSDKDDKRLRVSGRSAEPGGRIFAAGDGAGRPGRSGFDPVRFDAAHSAITRYAGRDSGGKPERGYGDQHIAHQRQAEHRGVHRQGTGRQHDRRDVGRPGRAGGGRRPSGRAWKWLPSQTRVP